MDDDDKKPENEAAEPVRDAAQQEGAKLREVSEEELKRILAAHETWLEKGREKGKKADLSRTDLQGANLQGAILRGTNFQEADLRGANLRGADLREANPQGATLVSVNFQDANLVSANLQDANLICANLRGASLHEANLRGGNLQEAKLQGAKLTGANLRKANLLNADLASANLQEANLRSANLQEANLRSADLQGANLRGANLRGANLRGANLQKAGLGGANLQDANLSYTKFKLAQLLDTDLQRANLRLANLQEAFLIRAKLQEAKLIEANLHEAKLIEADLEGADFSNADFRNADLSDAQLPKVIGLRADQLAGANLSNAKLPKDIAAFDGLDRVEEISQIARPIFIGILVGCVYSWLTIATTTDARLLTNSASSPLPIIGTEIPIVGFYWVAPILLLGVYIYLHLYLQRLWAGLADLPALFPDGSPLNKKVYPWLLSGLVRAHFRLLQDRRTLLSRLENGAAILLAWWIVPVTVLMFWGRYMPRHEWIGTGLHVALLVVSVGIAILLHRHAAATLRRDVTAFRWRRPWRDRRTHQGAVAVGLGAVFALVSLGAIEGDARRDGRGGPVVLGGAATWVPYAFDRVGYRTYASLREADVSTKPPTWTGLAELSPEKLDTSLQEKARAEFAQVKGAPLQGADLRHADAVRAFLVKADLFRANLQGADLRSANLQGADLIRANLQGANLVSANLQGAGLIRANLQGAKLVSANLWEADLQVAILQGADLFGANLQEAHLVRANLQGANLQVAILQGAILQGADLQGAGLESADLEGANLVSANLQRANLSWAKGLTREQLDAACGDEATKLPDYLADYQMKACPEPEQPPSN